MKTVRDMAKNDEINTPWLAVQPLLPYLRGHHPEYPKITRIWEMCPGSGDLIGRFRRSGFSASDFDIKDSLETRVPPDVYDVIVTNPPWSKKHLFLERCVTLDKPFALLLPVRTLGVRRCQIWLDDVDVLFLKRRVDYTGGNSPYEASAWFTRGLLPDRMVFET